MPLATATGTKVLHVAAIPCLCPRATADLLDWATSDHHHRWPLLLPSSNADSTSSLPHCATATQHSTIQLYQQAGAHGPRPVAGAAARCRCPGRVACCRCGVVPVPAVSGEQGVETPATASKRAQWKSVMGSGHFVLCVCDRQPSAVVGQWHCA
jgi:hypothetical protein